MMAIRKFKQILAFLSLCIAPTITMAQAYPDRPIKMVVPAPAGSFADIIGREFGTRLSKKLGQPVVIDNRGGASGAIAYSAVAKSAPDGYTILVTNTGPSAINPELFRAKGLSYNPIADLEPIALICLTPVALLVKADSPWKSVGDIVAFAQKNPDKLSFGTTGSGQLNHLSAEYLNSVAKMRTTHIPYTSGPAAITDLIGGRIDYLFYPPANGKPMIDDGRLRALAVTSMKRTVSLPDVPSLSELGYKEFDLSAWFGLAVPTGTPNEIAQKLWTVSKEIASDPEYVARLKQLGIDDVLHWQKMSRAELKQFHNNEVDRWGAIVKLAGASAQ
ncbi:Bug family tripartite tricarboxylate transporter substrate binding protein [Zwartia vadi]|uniref:Bug family tripartite tricarboxylate transporter substrate binding protein n=1 Tax=Zwartia vadi TaxID=3058168 RepID=UPI0025B626F4|nr:tripartite tricarboxylate transporter substrate binding protein [Zwartia vadi]MDN3986744.1 tripartite tricarboxylate transporter substrate binding protein [Zwartia vadi]